MTGAGSATVAFGKESSFQGSLSGAPDYYLPGRNITVEEIEASNALERLSLPDQAESVESIAGNFETGLSVSWAMSSDRVSDVQDIIFNSSGTSFTNGQAATSAWFLGLDHLSGTSERALDGVFPTEYTLEYSEDSNTLTESLTLVAADESENTSTTPSGINSAGAGTTVPFHGAQLDIDGTTITALSSFTLTISNIAQPITGASRHPLDAVIAGPETTLDFDATMKDGPQTLDYAYGSSGSSTTQDSVGGVSGTITASVGGTTATTFDLSEVTPDTNSWSDLVAQANAGEPVSAHVNGVSIS